MVDGASLLLLISAGSHGLGVERGRACSAEGALAAGDDGAERDGAGFLIFSFLLFFCRREWMAVWVVVEGCLRSCSIFMCKFFFLLLLFSMPLFFPFFFFFFTKREKGSFVYQVVYLSVCLTFAWRRKRPTGSLR